MAAAHQRLVAETLLKAEQKLEAVKRWYKENIPDWVYLRDYKVERSLTIMSSKLLELKEILEAEG